MHITSLGSCNGQLQRFALLGSTPWKYHTRRVGPLVFLTDMSELKKNLIKGNRALLERLGGAWITRQFCLEEKPVKATGSPVRPKERKLFPWREWHFGKLKITSVILYMRIFVTKKKCNKSLSLKASSIFYKSYNHLQLLAPRKIHMTNLTEH